MGKAFLYCEETDTKIRSNDVISITTYPGIKWVVKNGWYKDGTAQKRGWYFVSIADKTVLSIDSVDIKNIVKEDNQVISVPEERPIHADETQNDSPEVNVLYCDETDTKIYHNDIVEISGAKYVAKFGMFNVGEEYYKDWHFISLEDRTIVPLRDVDLTTITKEQILGTSELRPTLQDMDSAPATNNYLVIPNTDIRIYDSDIVKIDTKPNVKWIVHFGWYIYNEVQNYGWYFASIKDGAILPVSVIDLTLCSLETLKTQGSEIYDGKVVNYTRPFTFADAEVLKRAFITVETLEQRNNLDPKKLINGKLVRVNDVGGIAGYYYWDAPEHKWEKADFGGSSSGGIPEIEGTLAHPIILAQIDEGLYRVKGYYKITSVDEQTKYAEIDHIAFVSGVEDVQIEVITEKSITDYTVTGSEITFINAFATEKYVDDKITWLDHKISEIISELYRELPEIIDARIADRFEPIPDSFIRSLFE